MTNQEVLDLISTLKGVQTPEEFWGYFDRIFSVLSQMHDPFELTYEDITNAKFDTRFVSEEDLRDLDYRLKESFHDVYGFNLATLCIEAEIPRLPDDEYDECGE